MPIKSRRGHRRGTRSRRILLDQWRYPALPPRAGSRCRPDGPAGTALPSRRHPTGAADVRQRRAELPHNRNAHREVPRHRHRVEQGATRQRGRLRAVADPTVGHRSRGHQVHRHLGQGQGRGHLVEHHGTAPDGALLWTQKRSIFARGEGGFGGERGPSTSSEPPQRAPDFELAMAHRRRPQADADPKRPPTVWVGIVTNGQPEAVRLAAIRDASDRSGVSPRRLR